MVPSAPVITLKSVVDAGTHADKSADVTATIVSGAAVRVEFEIVQNFDDYAGSDAGEWCKPHREGHVRRLPLTPSLRCRFSPR